jgi:Putative Actinobacterial Holin-X, holin superfamily III
MPTPVEHRDGGGVQAAVQEVAQHARTLARLEAELATIELRRKVAALGAGAVVLAVGGVLALFALGFLLATVAAALANAVPTWLALLIVGGGLLVVAGVVLAIGAALLKRGVPPVPEQAIAEAKLTGSALGGRNDG